MKNILIAEDQPIMRAGTRQIVHDSIADANITEVDNFKKATTEACRKAFDLVIMEIGIPGGNSVNMIETFKRRWPSVRILILSSYKESLYAFPFIKAGADGYISKDAPEMEFKKALDTVLFRNKVYMSDDLREESFRLFFHTGKDLEETSAKLSVKEREIIGLLLSGKGVSQIASLLNLHVSTVSTHRARILRKMRVDNIMDLARIYNMLG